MPIIGSFGVEVARGGQRALLTAAHVVGALSDAADDGGRVMYVAGFGASPADRHIGRVVLRHPDTDVEEILLDAALVEPLPHVTCKNIVRGDATSCIGRDVEESIDEDNPVIVHKHGWKTGTTTGLLNPVPETLDVEGRRPDGATTMYTYLRGYFVLGDGGPFARPGDSGSIVIDDDNCVVGMIVALRTSDPNNITEADPAFVVPIVDLIEHLGVELIGPPHACTLI